jgi:hypothetical protein
MVDENTSNELPDAKGAFLSLVVYITNHGRAAVNVDQIMFEPEKRVEGESWHWGIRASIGAELPVRLESHSTLKWNYNFVQMCRFEPLLTSTGEPKAIRVSVMLGNGVRVKSKPEKYVWLHRNLPDSIHDLTWRKEG